MGCNARQTNKLETQLGVLYQDLDYVFEINYEIIRDGRIELHVYWLCVKEDRKLCFFLSL